MNDIPLENIKPKEPIVKKEENIEGIKRERDFELQPIQHKERKIDNITE